MDYLFRAQLTPDPEGGFLVTFPDVPEAISGGADEAEAKRNATEALGLALRGVLATGRPLPRSKAKAEGLVPIAVGATDALKLAVIEAFLAAGISKSELARRLGATENAARRILDPDYPTKLPTLETALRLLGKQLIVSVKDAA